MRAAVGSLWTSISLSNLPVRTQHGRFSSLTIITSCWDVAWYEYNHLHSLDTFCGYIYGLPSALPTGWGGYQHKFTRPTTTCAKPLRFWFLATF